MTMTDNPTAKELLEQIHSFIALSKEHVAQGGDADLSGLDGKVQELCEKVLDMPKPEADVYGKELAILADELTELRAGMETAQVEVREQISALNARQKAAKAYKTSEAIRNNSPKDDD